MINKKVFFTISALLMMHISFSQINIDSLIYNQPPSKSETINRLRSLLIDAVAENDKEKAREIHLYLSENFDPKSYVTLFPAESILLNAWYNDFENMFYNMSTFNLKEKQVETRILPAVINNFYQVIRERVAKELEEILFNLQATFLSQEEKDFATIFLHYCLVPFTSTEEYDTIVSQINIYTKKFIFDYPNSQYIKSLISHELKPSDWGWGFGISLGYAAKTGDYSTHFKDGVAADFFFDITYKNILLTMGTLFSITSARKDIVFNESVLPIGTSANFLSLYLSLGYRFLEGKRIMLTPTAGIGYAWVDPGSTDERRDNPALKQFDHSFGLTLNGGLMADIRFGKIKRVPGQNFVTPTFWGLRLSYKFSYNTLKETPQFYDGHLHAVSLGIYWYGKTIKRVKYE